MRPKVNFMPEIWLRIEDLKPHPKNPRVDLRTKTAQFELLKQSIEQGVFEPIKVSKKTGYCLAGHQRLKAFEDLGFDEVPCMYNDCADEKEEIEILIKDNNEWGAYDYELLGRSLEEFKLDPVLMGLNEFDVKALDEASKQNERDATEDDVPEAPVEPKAKLGDIYQLGNHRLMCGDSTKIEDVEKLMDGQKADMVFTDPPYGVLEETNRKDKKRSRETKSYNFSKVIGDESENAAKAAFNIAIVLGNSIVYWGANNYSFLPISRGWIVWDKRENKGIDDNGDAELAWTNFDKPIRTFYHLWKGMIKRSEQEERRVHPTQKPIALAEWCFENYGNPKSILDLFGGSGSTLIACEKTGRSCYMMELDPKYIDVIIKRWEDYTKQKAVKL